MRTGRLTVLVLLAVLTGLTGCSGDPDHMVGGGSSVPPTPSISTLSPLPMPSMGPPPGEIVADLRQSSRDAALGRFQVWVGNGLDRVVNPRSIEYVDPRFRAAITGERLRPNPAGSERGYPLALPARPDCAHQGMAVGTIELTYADRTVTVAVEDEADVVERYIASRCFELALDRVATLTFEDAVARDKEGEGSVGTLVLTATPSGVPGGTLTIDSVGGTPLLTPQSGSAWTPARTVRSDDDVTRIELPMIPARCDDHVFMESGGATAFRVQLHLDGEAGELVVRMSSAGAAAAIGFARDSCGLG